LILPPESQATEPCQSMADGKKSKTTDSSRETIFMKAYLITTGVVFGLIE
jgi:hypothetical protein